MTTQQLKQTILAEIERRLKECKRDDGRINPPRTRNAIVYDEFTEFKAFIEALPEEATAVGTVDTTARPKNIIVKTEDWEALFDGFENGEKAIITISKEAEV